jgi:glucans biosynthesis protein
MHGGAQGSGAPKGNRNALKHGTYTKEAFRERAELRDLVQESRDLLRTLQNK